MSDEVLGDLRRALEEAFFRKRNQPLFERLRAELASQAQQEALVAVSGITDEAVLKDLVQAGLTSETLAAVTLVPAIEVAWADGKLDEKERQAILAAAAQAKINHGTAAYALLDCWLDAPAPALRTVWLEYVSALCARLDLAAKAGLKEATLGRAQTVAEASGGILGFGNKVSGVERAVLKELETAFR